MSAAKEIAASALIAGSITASLFCIGQAASIINAPEAHAVNYCTQDYPYAPQGGICTSIGISTGDYCSIGLNCSPVPGQPGTLNPLGGGYTPPWCSTTGNAPGCRNY